MRTSLAVPYVDVRADDLAWRVGDDPERPALALLEVAVARRVRIVARILGSSHQVVLDAPDLRCVETVACGAGDALPRRAVTDLAAGRYRFGARVRRHDEAQYRCAVAHVARLGDRGDAIVAAFGSAPDALTAVVVDGRPDAGLVAWRSWHTYPQTREVVVTRGEVVLGRRGGGP